MKAMILAAGRGERLRPLTDKCPKPLVKVAGKSLIEYHIEKLAAVGFLDIVINHAWLGHMLQEQLGTGMRWGVNLQYSAEPTALETGGGIKQALTFLGDEPFFVINGDVFIDELPAIKPLAAGILGHLYLVDNPKQHPAGDFSLSHGKASVQGDNKLTFSGIGVYDPRIFNATPDGAFGLAPLLKDKMALGLITAEKMASYWCDVGTLERLQSLNERQQNHLVHQ